MNLKMQVDVLKVDGYSLDVEQSLITIIIFLENSTVCSSSITLEGTLEDASFNASYQTVDTKLY